MRGGSTRQAKEAETIWGTSSSEASRPAHREYDKTAGVPRPEGTWGRLAPSLWARQGGGHCRDLPRSVSDFRVELGQASVPHVWARRPV